MPLGFYIVNWATGQWYDGDGGWVENIRQAFLFTKLNDAYTSHDYLGQTDSTVIQIMIA